MKRQNCWEYRKCGREPGGRSIAELGKCPAATDMTYNGINAGKNAGRICWAVAGTFCNGEIQGTYADKRKSCVKCRFFRLVQADEGIGKSDAKFLRFISKQHRNPIFNSMTSRTIRPGERFVFQGEMENTAFIIQHGSCLAIVEKDGELHPVNHYGEGDIVGGLGILTGESRRVHVEAETEMEVWVLEKEQFDDISKKDPEIQNFLTEIVADRFDSRRPTAYRTIGKYVATDIIGRGGYSVVYKGVHSALNMPVAIKMMRHNMAIEPNFLATFHNEARTIASLDHENIINVYDYEERFKTVFIIMELVEGRSLKDVAEHLKTIPPLLAAYYITQVCRGLDYAHQKGIIHRDINPTNIIVQQNDRLKILDFGLACLSGTDDFGSIESEFYISPEQIEGYAVDQRSDIYSLGLTAFEIVTGRKPYPEENLRELKKMRLNLDIPDPIEIVNDIPEDLRRFILKACNRDPSKRYQNANQALEVLKPLSQKHETTHSVLSSREQKMTNIFLLYGEDQQLPLSYLMEEFSESARKIGATLKVVDF